MSWNDEASQRELQRRIDATIARAATRSMSDAKWRKLFQALHELGIEKVRWKFLRDERVFVASVPSASVVLEGMLGDVLPYPYGPFREIEWIEIPAEFATGLSAALEAIGKFPVQQLDSGVRVVAYQMR